MRKKNLNENSNNEKAEVENIEQTIIELSKQENSPSKIGMILKAKYNVPSVKPLRIKITKILEKNKIKYKNDLNFVNERIKRIEKHYEKNKQDKRAKREIVRLVELKKRLEKYYETKNK
ncbi:MAG: 30S ribosomal protein S15 [Candidatus Pacearchaeota archaeon]